MGPSEKSFNQVKAILGKLDRSIDQLRERRKNPAPVLAAPPSAPARVAPQPIPLQPAPPRPGSPYGRATPLPPAGG